MNRCPGCNSNCRCLTAPYVVRYSATGEREIVRAWGTSDTANGHRYRAQREANQNNTGDRFEVEKLPGCTPYDAYGPTRYGSYL